jgi:hypothetical protein
MRILLLLPIMAGALYADVTKTCNNATIQGTYGYSINGSSVAGGPGPLEIAMGVGVRHYDGDGNFTQVDVVKRSVSGPLIDLPNAGTYVVNPDCTGAAYLGGAPGSPTTNETRFIVVNGGKEIYWIVLTPAFFMVSGHAVRQ